MSPDSNRVVFLGLALVPILVSALLNAGEAAIIYTDDAHLKHQESTGDRKAAKMLRLLGNYKTLEPAVLSLTALCLMTSFYGFWRLFDGLADTWRLSPRLVLILALAIGGLLFLALGKITPRRLAAYYYEGMAFALLGLLSLARVIMLPFVSLLDLVSALVVRLSGKDPSLIPHRVTEEEIRMLVDEGEVRGVIEESEKDMINNIFEFDERTVDEVMTHRTEVSAADLDASLDELVAIALETGYSRIPVYEDDIDSVVGIIYAKDLLKFIDRAEAFSVRSTMRKPLYIPETTKCNDLFAIFKREKTQIAVVIDEYGGTYGIVTMEDLLEAIVGSMQDEYDNEEELSTEVEEGVYILDGSMPISLAERLLDIHIPDDSESDTLGGFITELLGGIPREDARSQSIHFGGATFTILEADQRKILTVRAVIKSLNP